MTKLFLAIIIFTWGHTTLGQVNVKGDCYKKTVGKNAQIFTRTLYYPKYNQGDILLSLFLADNINLSEIYKSITDTMNLLEDSIKLKFIISKEAQMSDISLNTRSIVLSSELTKAIIKSSCDWIPGGTEMYLPVWYTGTVYIKLEKQKDSFQLTVSVKSDNPGR